MREAYAAIGEMAKTGGAKTCTDRKETCTVSPLQAAISNLIKFQNPLKTWAFVAEKFGLKERTAKYRLSNETSYTIEELQALFQSEDGLEYFEAMMADSRPKWWVALQKEISLCRARGIQEQARQLVLSVDVTELEIPSRRRLKRFSDADRRLNAIAADKETAVGVFLAEPAGPVHSAMAQAKTKIPAAGMRAGGRGR